MRAEGLADQRHLRRLAAQLLANPVQPRLRQRQRLGVAVESDQPSRRAQPPHNAFGVSGQAQRAVHIRAAGPHAEKIDRFFKKNRHMACFGCVMRSP